MNYSCMNVNNLEACFRHRIKNIFFTLTTFLSLNSEFLSHNSEFSLHNNSRSLLLYDDEVVNDVSIHTWIHERAARGRDKATNAQECSGARDVRRVRLF